MKIRSVVAEGCSMRMDRQTDRGTDGRTDGETDRQKLVVTCRNFANAPKNRRRDEGKNMEVVRLWRGEEETFLLEFTLLESKGKEKKETETYGRQFCTSLWKMEATCYFPE
jgi:hypothetical protein